MGFGSHTNLAFWLREQKRPITYPQFFSFQRSSVDVYTQIVFTLVQLLDARACTGDGGFVFGHFHGVGC
jgi:hypothetical protein